MSLSPRAEVHVIRIVQEALTNVRKHARARSVLVSIRGTDTSTSFVIADDGVGFDPEVTAGSQDGYGLFTMRDRAALLGGTVQRRLRARTRHHRHGERPRAAAPLLPSRRTAMSAPTRILLVDDQPLFRGAIAALLASQPDMEVVGEAENGLVGVEMAGELHPDLVILDVDMPVMNGVEAVRLIREQVMDVKVIMLTVSDVEDHVMDALRNGAHGYLLKDLRPEQLHDMIRSVMRNETPISPAVAGRLLREIRDGGCAEGHLAVPRAGPVGGDPARARDPPAGGRGPQQQGDRQAARHHRGHGEEPRAQRPREAAPRQPDPGRGVRHPPGARVPGRPTTPH